MVATVMTDEKKETDDQPTFVISQTKASNDGKQSFRPTRKHVIIAIVTVVIVALIIIGALVGMHLYYEGNKEVFKYKMKINEETEEDVITEGNVVQYHTVSHDAETWFIHDFDKGIQITKIKTDEKEVCFLTALNKSNAEEPHLITSTPHKPENITSEIRLFWEVSNTTVDDVSFLGERVKKLCDKVPTHWMVPSCQHAAEDAKIDEDESERNSTVHAKNRQKRCLQSMSPCGSCRRTTSWRRCPGPPLLYDEPIEPRPPIGLPAFTPIRLCPVYTTYPCRCGCCTKVCGTFIIERCVKVYVRCSYYVHFYMSYVANGGTCRTSRISGCSSYNVFRSFHNRNTIRSG